MDGLATEGIVLQIKEPGSSLNIGHAIRRRALQTGKYLAASQCPLELADEYTHGARAVSDIASNIIGLVATSEDADAKTFPQDTPIF